MTVAFEETRSRKVAAARTGAKKQKRVVIVGGGFAGLAAAHALRHADAEVILIDRRNHHIFQPLLYQVATAVLSPAEIAAPIRQLEAKQKNLSVLLAEVTGVDVASRTIEACLPGRRRPQDRVRLFGGRDRHAPQLFRPRRVRAICAGSQESRRRRDDPSQNPERVRTGRTTDDEDERARQMTFVLVGAGPTGVELAASLAHMVKVRCAETSAASIPRKAPASFCSTAAIGFCRLLPRSLSRRGHRRLKKLGVKVMTGT